MTTAAAVEPQMPADRCADADGFEDALLEARACGDVGFVDRMWSWWYPELDEPRPDSAQDGTPHPSEDAAAGWTPADPLERFGPAVFLQLASRAKNQADAAFLAAVHQTGHAQGRYDTRGYPCRDPFALPEIAMALGHAVGTVGYQLRLAEAVVERLPKLHAAMAEGWLDLTKAVTFVDSTTGMPDDLARMVVARLLPQVSSMTKKTLAEQIGLVAGQLDPDWATRREQAARARGRVEYVQNPAGTGDVALRDLSAEALARIHARGDALAHPLRRAARRLGLPLGLPALRLLASQRLLDGTYVGFDDDALLAALIDELPAWHAELTGVDEAPDSDPGCDGLDGEDGPAGGGPGDGGPGDGGPGDGGPEPRDGGDSESAESEVRASAADPALVDATSAGSARSAGGALVGTVELRMRLSTVLGLDQLPATIPGTGTVTARSARGMLATIRDGAVTTEYRLVLVDPDGHLDHVLLVRPDPPPTDRRPPGPARARGQVKGTVIVELAAPTTMLAALRPDDHPEWAGYLRRARARMAVLAERGQDLGGPDHPATTTVDARKRLPGAALDRWIRVRDRHCIGPMCRRTAHSAEIDHTRDWAYHGLTVAANLSPPCAHCHALKHVGGWDLTQPCPGRFEWTSPLGATCTVEPRPVLEPPPAPAPRADGRPRPILDVRRPPRPTDTGDRRRSPRRVTPDDIPVPRNGVPPDRDEPPPF